MGELRKSERDVSSMWTLVLTDKSKRLRERIIETVEKTKTLGEMRKIILKPHVIDCNDDRNIVMMTEVSLTSCINEI